MLEVIKVFVYDGYSFPMGPSSCHSGYSRRICMNFLKTLRLGYLGIQADAVLSGPLPAAAHRGCIENVVIWSLDVGREVVLNREMGGQLLGGSGPFGSGPTEKDLGQRLSALRRI